MTGKTLSNKLTELDDHLSGPSAKQSCGLTSSLVCGTDFNQFGSFLGDEFLKHQVGKKVVISLPIEWIGKKRSSRTFSFTKLTTKPDK